jgi:hypothetical protein
LEHPSAVATLSIVILLSARLNFPTAAALLRLSQSQEGDLVGHDLQLSNVLKRISLPSCEPLHRKQETFLYEYPLHRITFPQKNVQQNVALR